MSNSSGSTPKEAGNQEKLARSNDENPDVNSGIEPTLLWKENQPYFCAPPNNGDPWTECLNSVRRFDDEKCKGWREDIDTLLVFAGLFSATVTAFATQSYQWLQATPSPQEAILLRFLHTTELYNRALDVTTLAPPTPASVRINAFWFLSLTISLATVLLGILCKQWLREYQKDASVSHHLALELRQMRLESLQRWGVPGILNVLPLLLQLALVLFFAGLLDLLWSLHPVVAGLISAVIGLTMFIVVMTSILPACYIVMVGQRQRSLDTEIFPCPYKSPQSWLFYKLVLGLFSLVSRRKLESTDWVSCDLHLLRAWLSRNQELYFCSVVFSGLR
ncbi:hypothetical protein BDP27DRAFT_238751 [Rhodocollybia butyracea]|uniref:DUF6535 domain-containing protein n=1 Tax=Rhodocollybia butyracea TaxID=206335 RepID=A0A9P5PHR4_9AGAR|nr:hypothetical protein BDP27DRAFT_238751 [Rhodocollybia butyracea]